ncbi:unnamed protein product [Vitrella brassicaformis CCMP3155]|uniref:Uncharacterized protein n=2 Tax=Vitrella brassicaformis TaxID=1169539 RepID=A0A0G4EAN3_VITBC|nr:unnamed protein product [Vitrella brassicaformis CCMP3155]|eukprot:CEL92480.1 unnamed protein product [Vitrella brassicaformis CCMP3155]
MLVRLRCIYQVHYCTNYAAKMELPISEMVAVIAAGFKRYQERYGDDDSDDVREQCFKLVRSIHNMIKSKTQFSAPQVAMILLGLGKKGEKYVSHDFQPLVLSSFLAHLDRHFAGDTLAAEPTHTEQESYTITLQQKGRGPRQIVLSNQVDDYIHRPTSRELQDGRQFLVARVGDEVGDASKVALPPKLTEEDAKIYRYLRDKESEHVTSLAEETQKFLNDQYDRLYAKNRETEDDVLQLLGLAYLSGLTGGKKTFSHMEILASSLARPTTEDSPQIAAPAAPVLKACFAKYINASLDAVGCEPIDIETATEALSKTSLDDRHSACQSNGSRQDQLNDDLQQQRKKLCGIGHSHGTSDEASLLSSFSSNLFTHGGHSMDAADLTRLLAQPASAFKPPETGDDKNREDLLCTVASRCQLNEEQMRAFQIICSHLLNHYKDLQDNKYVTPLRMCLTGEGGTGKTHVIKAVKAYFAELQCRHWLRLAAPTGVAADNIGGSTLDSLLHIFDDFKSGDKRLRRQAVKQQTIDGDRICREESWKHIHYMIVDEISFVNRQKLDNCLTERVFS